MTLIKDHQWKLEIRSFYGIVAGAVHFSGEMRRNCYVPDPTTADTWLRFQERCRVERALKPGEAIRLSTRDFQWEAGTYSDRYWAKSQVIRRAKEVFPLIAEEGDFLTLGHADRLLCGTRDDYVAPNIRRTVYYPGPEQPKDIEHDVQELEEQHTQGG